jgi:3-methyladenine DNA glycosylase AlkD
MSKQSKEIQTKLAAEAVKSNRDFFAKMVPGTQNIYGVKTPILNEIVKKYKEGSFDLAEELWNAGSLEERIIAIKILEKTGKKDPERLLKLFKAFSSDIDNWAVCDGLGMQFLRSIVKTHQAEIFALAKKMNHAKSFWQRRLSLVMVEWYTRMPATHKEIRELVAALKGDDEYYVKKAITWINRNFEKKK